MSEHVHCWKTKYIEEHKNVNGMSCDCGAILSQHQVEHALNNSDIVLWPDPSPSELEIPEFKAIWRAIKTWDINVPAVYSGYCGATGNHVKAIFDALQAVEPKQICPHCKIELEEPLEIEPDRKNSGFCPHCSNLICILTSPTSEDKARS